MNDITAEWPGVMLVTHERDAKNGNEYGLIQWIKDNQLYESVVCERIMYFGRKRFKVKLCFIDGLYYYRVGTMVIVPTQIGARAHKKDAQTIFNVGVSAIRGA